MGKQTRYTIQDKRAVFKAYKSGITGKDLDNTFPNIHHTTLRQWLRQAGLTKPKNPEKGVMYVEYTNR